MEMRSWEESVPTALQIAAVTRQQSHLVQIVVVSLSKMVRPLQVSLAKQVKSNLATNTKAIQLNAAAKLLQSCLTLCNPIDSSPPGSPIPGVLQARTLEWVAISFSNAWKWKVKSLSCVRLLATPWTAPHQPPPSMGFSRQEYWSGVPLPSPYN